MVLLDKPPHWVSSKSAMVDYYVEILAKVLGKWVLFHCLFVSFELCASTFCLLLVLILLFAAKKMRK